MRIKIRISPKLDDKNFLYFWVTFSRLNLISVVLWETLRNLLPILGQPVSLGVNLLQVEVSLDNLECLLYSIIIEVSD